MKIKTNYVNAPIWKELAIKSTLPQELECLDEIAHNLWWSWNYEARDLWRALDRDLFEKVGEKAGRWLERELVQKNRSSESVNIVMLTGTEGSSSQIGRSAGFAAVAERHANWNILEEKCAEFTSTKGREVMKTFLKRYPDIDVVVSQNDDMTFGAIEAIRESGRTVGVNGDIMILSFDAVRGALDMVADGTINVDIECNPNQGEYLLRVIDMLEAGETVEKKYYVEEDVFTVENVTQELLQERTY